MAVFNTTVMEPKWFQRGLVGFKTIIHTIDCMYKMARSYLNVDPVPCEKPKATGIVACCTLCCRPAFELTAAMKLPHNTKTTVHSAMSNLN